MASERIIIYYNDAQKLLTDRNNNNKNADDHNKIKYNNRNSNSSDIDGVKKVNSVGNDSGNISSNLFSTKNDNKIISEVKKLTTWLQKHQNEIINDNMKIKLFTIIEMYYRYSLSIIMSNNNKVNNNSSSVSINKTKNNMKDQVILTTTITTTTTTNNSGDDGSNNDNNAHLLSDIILSLLTTYLQLPEGKLLNSKDKKKILSWLQNYNNNNGMTNDGISDEKSSNGRSSSSSSSRSSNISNIWSVEEIKDDNTVTLLNKVNYELWKEDYNISNIHQYKDDLKKKMMLRSSCGNRSSGDGGENEVTDDHDNTNDGGIVYIELDELLNAIIRIVS
jgi:hypothetical protein